jgi:ankyrin repeat protein
MDDETPLAISTRDGDFNAVLQLLKERADPNVTDILGETPLFEAAASGDEHIAALLLLSRADPSQRSHAGGVAKDMAESTDVQALIDAFSTGSAREAEQAALNALDPQVVGELIVSLSVASEQRRQSHAALSPVVQQKLEQDAKSNFLTVPGYTHVEVDGSEEPELSVAVREGSLERVRRLLVDKADPNCLDVLKEPPIFEAAASGNVAIASVLLLAGADPSYTTKSGDVALELASEKPMRALLQLATGAVLDDERLSTLVLKQLPAQLKAPVMRHLKQCNPCLANPPPAPETSPPAPTALSAAIAASIEAGLSESPKQLQAKEKPAVVDRSIRPPDAKTAPIRNGVAEDHSLQSDINRNSLPRPGSHSKKLAGTSSPSQTAELPRSRREAEVDEDSPKHGSGSTSSDSDCDDGFIALLKPERSAPVEVVDVELLVKKAVGVFEVRIQCRSNSTFQQVKDMLIERLDRPDLRARIWLVHRSESGVYVSYKDADIVGDVREVLFLAPNFNSDE